MSLINCQECKAEISDQATKCPKCGAGRSSIAGVVILVVIIVLTIIFMLPLFNGGVEKSVTEDQIKEYEIARRNGSTMDRCVRAGFVVAACSQEKNEECYKAWKATERKDCSAAGVPRY